MQMFTRRSNHADIEPRESSGDVAFLTEKTRQYRQLAMRVIALALEDLSTPGRAPEDRASARAFFASSWVLDHWCEVARVDAKRLGAYARTLKVFPRQVAHSAASISTVSERFTRYDGVFSSGSGVNSMSSTRAKSLNIKDST